MSSSVVPRYYPFPTRMIASLFDEGRLSNVAAVEIEPEFGYTTRLTYRDGSRRVTRGNDLGLNPGAACEVVRDKAFTKYFLRRGGISCPIGETFVLRWWAERLHAAPATRGMPIRDVENVIGYIEENLELPVFVKPVNGFRGYNVWCCDSTDEVLRVLDLYERERVSVALVEERISLPDFRVVVLDAALVFACRRVPFSVVGDGESSVTDLVLRLQDAAGSRARLVDMGDGRIAARLRRCGMEWQSVPPAGAVVQLHDISNLSAGGTAIDCTDGVSDRWRELAVSIADQFGLRFCGIDLACADITSDNGEYSVIEVNATPGLDHYGAVGAEQGHLVRELYARVLNRWP